MGDMSFWVADLYGVMEGGQNVWGHLSLGPRSRGTHQVGSEVGRVSRVVQSLPVISYLPDTCQGCRRPSPWSWQSLILNEIVGFFPCSHLELIFDLLKVTARVPLASPEVRHLGRLLGCRTLGRGSCSGFEAQTQWGLGGSGKPQGWLHGCLVLRSQGLLSLRLTSLPSQEPHQWPQSPSL